MKRNAFLSGSLMSMVEQGFASMTSFLTGIIIARATNLTISGSYALLLSIVMIFLGLQRVVIAVPFNVHYPKMQNEKDKMTYISASAGIEVVFLILLVAAIPILRIFIFHEAAVIPLIIFFIGYLVKDCARQYFFGINRIVRCLIMSCTQCVIQIVLLFLLAKDDMSFNAILMVIGCSCMLCTVVFLIGKIRVSLHPRALKKAWKTNWWTAKWSIGISMSDSIKNQLALWLIKLFISIDAVAIFNNNNTLAVLPQPVFVGLSQYLLPNFSAAFAEKKDTLVKKRLLMVGGLILVCNFLWAGILFFIGRQLMNWLYGKEYLVGTAVLMVCCIRGIFMSFVNMASAVLQAVQRPQIIMRTLMFSIAFLAVGGSLLIWKAGIMGACITMLMVYAIPATMQIVEIIRVFKERK